MRSRECGSETRRTSESRARDSRRAHRTAPPQHRVPPPLDRSPELEEHERERSTDHRGSDRTLGREQLEGVIVRVDVSFRRKARALVHRKDVLEGTRPGTKPGVIGNQRICRIANCATVGFQPSPFELFPTLRRARTIESWRRAQRAKPLEGKPRGSATRGQRRTRPRRAAKPPAACNQHFLARLFTHPRQSKGCPMRGRRLFRNYSRPQHPKQFPEDNHYLSPAGQNPLRKPPGPYRGRHVRGS